MSVLLIVIILLAALSAANGANDVSKGVATLVGSGVTRYRTAILWGAVTTLAGSLLSGLLAARMLALFSSGIVSAKPTPVFTLAVMLGTTGWVAVATIMRLPVSTTHAIIGSLIGAGVFYAPASIEWAAILPRLVVPLLLSIAVSYVFSAALNRVFARHGEAGIDCLCVGSRALDTGTVELPQVSVIAGTREECSAQRGYLRLNTEMLHWLSSGAVGFARGLNDAPKLVAIAAVGISVPMSLQFLLLLVSAAMFAGSLFAGRRVAVVLAEKVVPMDHREGFVANLATALLVGIGSNLGLPMSTTQVSTGAIAGIAGAYPERLNRRTVRDLVWAWTATPFAAGLIAGVSYLIAGWLI